MVVALGMTGCSAGSGGADDARKSAGGREEPPAAPAAQTVALKQPTQRKMIYKGDVSLVCENLERASEALEKIVRHSGGYISQASNVGTRGEVRLSSWTVKVPSDEFDNFLIAIRSVGELESSHRQAQDVTEEYFDAQAHLKNKTIEEQRLIELLKRDSGRLTDVLTVEKELSRVRGEIELIQGRLTVLQNQTSFSTIEINLREVKNFVPAGPPTLTSRVGRAFGGSVDALGAFGISALLLVVALVPWIAPVAVVGYLIWRLTRKRATPLK